MLESIAKKWNSQGLQLLGVGLEALNVGFEAVTESTSLLVQVSNVT